MLKSSSQFTIMNSFFMITAHYNLLMKLVTKERSELNKKYERDLTNPDYIRSDTELAFVLEELREMVQRIAHSR